MRDECHSEHLPRNLSRFVSTAGELHAAALAASTGMNLRLHHNNIAAQLFCRLVSLFRRARHDAARHRHTISLQQFFTLVLMNFHASASDMFEFWNAASVAD